MQPLEPRHRKLVLVCTNERTDGRECCAQKGSLELFHELKARLKEIDPSVRTSKTGCLDRCSSGATVAIMPDNVWLGGVTQADIDSIIQLVTKPL